jgi:Rrf2 family protein
MFITREADYAIRVLRAVADGEQSNVGEICKKEILPQQFVYKILKKIEQMGLIRIMRGAQGGCVLVGDLRKTSLYDLINSLEGYRAISDCMKKGHECEWKKQHAMPCTVHKQLVRIQGSLEKELRGCSLHKLIFDVE